MSALFAAITVLAAAIVIFRSVCVLNRLHWTTHPNSYAHFLGFGLSYVLLAGGSMLAAIDAMHGVLSLAGMLVVVASSGMVFFDSRRKT